MFWCLRIIIFILLILYNFIVIGQSKLLNTIVDITVCTNSVICLMLESCIHLE